MVHHRTVEIKSVLAEKRSVLQAEHEAGASGLEICEKLCKTVDSVIIDLVEKEMGEYNGAVVALGGYGRGLLNPYSDIDLLFLLANSTGGKTHRPPDRLLARLWDLGLKVGHSSRTISDAISIGLSDLYSRTSMMESRILAGDVELYDRFCKKYLREVVHRKPGAFIKSKIEEMNRRHAANGLVVHLTEPNVKESKGGLRDFHTAMWIIRAREDVYTIEQLAERGMTDRQKVGLVNDAHSFLLRLRNSMHWCAGASADTLSHALQPDIARLEGLTGSDNQASAQLMRKYYQAAEVIDHYVSELVALATAYKSGWRLWGRSLRVDKDGLFSDKRYLHARSFPPDKLDEGPRMLLRIAQRLSDENLEPAPNLMLGLGKIADTAPTGWFTGPGAGQFLVSVLALENSARAIKAFHRSGIIARFIPETKAIINLSQFDMFHKYTVDEHILATLDNLESIPRGAPVCPELVTIYNSQPDLETIKLALLLHDLGKSAEDRHATETDGRTPAILRRLGLDRMVEPIGLLVKDHLLMSNTAQRLDFTERDTLRGFCYKVRDRINLKRLYILTYADIASVGPDIWNGWKDNILKDLYEAADKYLIEGDAMFAAEREMRQTLTLRSTGVDSDFSEDEITQFLSKASMRYLSSMGASEVIDHMALVDRLVDTKVAMRFTPGPAPGTGVITLVSKAKAGFFSTVAGALAAKDISIIDAKIHTFSDGLAIDAFTVRGASLSLFSHMESLTKFENELGGLVGDEKTVADMVARRVKYIRKIRELDRLAQPPQALIMNHLSESSTVVELWARDRIGLLYDITRIMSELELDIISAKINTEGNIAINVFYIMDKAGGRIENEERKERIRQSLLAVIT